MLFSQGFTISNKFIKFKSDEFEDQTSQFQTSKKIFLNSKIAYKIIKLTKVSFFNLYILKKFSYFHVWVLRLMAEVIQSSLTKKYFFILILRFFLNCNSDIV